MEFHVLINTFIYNPSQSILFTYDNFNLTFPHQLQAKLQQEFGNNQLSSLNNNGNHHRKKITSGKKGTKGGGGGFTIGSDDINKKVCLWIKYHKRVLWVQKNDLFRR